jgi:hypothetical protein
MKATPVSDARYRQRINKPRAATGEKGALKKRGNKIYGFDEDRAGVLMSNEILQRFNEIITESGVKGINVVRGLFS